MRYTSSLVAALLLVTSGLSAQQVQISEGGGNPSIVTPTVSYSVVPSSASTLIVPSTTTPASADLAKRGKDLAQVVSWLREQGISPQQTYIVVKGVSYNNVVNFTLMDEGTVAMVTFQTPQGNRYQMVHIEDIQDIGHR